MSLLTCNPQMSCVSAKGGKRYVMVHNLQALKVGDCNARPWGFADCGRMRCAGSRHVFCTGMMSHDISALQRCSQQHLHTQLSK